MNPTRMRTRPLAAAFAATLLLAGCASPMEREPESGPTLDRIREALDEGAAASEPEETPADVEAALMPGMEEQLSDEKASAGGDTERFDLSVTNASARAFFMGLVEGTPYNMVVHPDVEGEISLELKDVTIPEVMDIARRVYGYEFERRSTGYIVMPARMESQIFYVDYLNVNRDGESNMSVASGEVTSAPANGNSGNNNGGSSRRTQDPGSRIATSSQANFWGTLRETVRSIIGSGEGRSVVVDPQAGLVVVRAMPGELRDVRGYLGAAEENLQRQVVLEAKILEVRLSESNETGINWAALGDGANGDAVIAGQGTISQGTTDVLTDSGAFDPTSITSPGGTGGAFDFGGIFAIGARANDFAALIRLLDTQGDVQVLSSPRVSTLNNQKAVIKVGTDEFFVTDVQTDTDTTAATSTRSVDVDLTPFFSGIALDVTPQISQSGSITLHVHPTVSEVTDQQKSITFAGQQQSLPLAVSQVRESDSVVRAKDGQVIVIGGLMQDQATRNRAQPGGLGDLPLVGGLFRQKADSSSRSELVILLRPMITGDGGGDWSDQIREMRERLPDSDVTGDGQGAASQ
ncbi:pilus (MSHA type) biogenesis protein MshL [Halofilum ochraceum]|uniref:pilus (MSHA type) biogenesis protein MshL n=1 Tax=Halofilum ochraceum TaxID=1611323 RepID=UPI0008DA9D22|nr:pilus (MSHA type) biogenesis protein MshL [Halofilum ochraceum]